jgi:Spy/CpxP family protein refolding chaperone
MMRKLAVAAFAVAMLVTPLANAIDLGSEVTDMQALRKAVREDKRSLVESALMLTPREEKKFWPLYSTYQRHLDASNRRRVVAVEALVAADSPISELYARNVANELVASDEAEIRARRALQKGVLKALPPKKAARYLQLEAKARAVQAYDMAAAIPLIR